MFGWFRRFIMYLYLLNRAELYNPERNRVEDIPINNPPVHDYANCSLCNGFGVGPDNGNAEELDDEPRRRPMSPVEMFKIVFTYMIIFIVFDALLKKLMALQGKK